MNVLIVEDDHNFAQMLKKSFLDFGHKVKLLFDGKQAISFIDRAVPDLVILDFYMPGHNAVEFVNELKSYSDTKEVLIYIYSAHAANIYNLPMNVLVFDKTKITPKELAELSTINKESS